MDFFVSWQFIVFCLGISGIIYVIRSFVEYTLANNKKFSKNSKIWRNLVLPILPVFIGAISPFIFKTYPYPQELMFNGGKIIFGIVAGLLSGLVYRVFKGVLYQKFNDSLPNETISVNAPINPEIMPGPETSNNNVNN